MTNIRRQGNHVGLPLLEAATRMTEDRRRTREDGRGKTDEGRRTREEGRGKTDEGRGKRDEGRQMRDGLEERPEISHIFFNSVLAISAAFDYALYCAASV